MSSRPFKLLHDPVRLSRRALRFVLCLSLLAPALSVGAKGKPSEVQELAYGEVLFDFFQENYFDALSRVQRAQVHNELDYHKDEARLLEGGMSLAYGMDRAATHIFNDMLNEKVRPEVRDRAWYYLARIAHQKGQPDAASAALAKIEGKARHDRQSEQTLLLGHVRLAQGDAAAAAAAFGGWRGPKSDQSYAEYNHGIALMRQGDLDGALKLLDKLGDRSVDTDEERALRDKTNLALGYYLLQQDKAAQARPYFDRVRLDGPLSNRALLGAGWADAKQERYPEALVPWLELYKRDSRDLAVQETWLAVPYAYAQLGAQGRAVVLYQDAIDAFVRESQALEVAISALNDGLLIDTLMTAEGTGRSWFWQLAQLPDTPQTRYLVEMLAGHRFQEAVKNLRDLKELDTRLATWSEQVDTFDYMIESRRQRFAAQAESRKTDLDRLDVAALANRHQVMQTELERIAREQDALGLMTDKERAAWQQLEQIEARLARHPDNPRIQLLRDKHRRLRGALLWKVEGDYKPRLRAAQHALEALVAPLDESTQLAERARTAYSDAPHSYEGFDGRIDDLRSRVMQTQSRVQTALAEQGNLITRLAQADLEQRKRRVDAYLVQARFALAQTYDQAGQVAPAPAQGVQP